MKKDTKCPKCGYYLDIPRLEKFEEINEGENLIFESTYVFCPNCKEKLTIKQTTTFKNNKEN